MSNKKNSDQKNKQGFTLIELMVVIAIIAILATVGLVVYSTLQKTARISKRVQDLQALQSAVETYKIANGVYPINTSYTCVFGGMSGSSTTIAGLAPNYMPALPTDPTPPNCYWYISDAVGSNYKIRTGGSTSTTDNSDLTVGASGDYKSQYGLIDPARDQAVGGTADCILEATNSAAFAPRAWAVYTSGVCSQ